MAAAVLRVVGAAALGAAIAACSPEPRPPPSPATATPAPAAATAPAPTVEAAPATAAPTAPAAPTATPSPTPAPSPGDLHPCEQGIAIPSPETKPDLVADCRVLLALQATLAGSVDLGWSAARSISLWEGVQVSDGRVSGIVLTGLELTGSIPPELSGLTGLQILLLLENELTGSIPPELGSLNELSSLGLSGNQLSGGIPPELGRLTNLTTLALDRNQLSGGIPPQLGRLTKLRELLLHENRLSGAIPEELGGLAQLTSLFLNHNELTGGIPPELGMLARLRNLDLRHNRLAGAIPSQLGALTALAYAAFEANQLTRCLWPPGAVVAAAALAASGLADCAEEPAAAPAPELTPAQRVAFVGDVAAERQATLRAAVEDAAAFFETRYGIAVADYRLYFSPDAASAAALYEELTGRPSPLADGRVVGVVTTTEDGPLGFVLDRPYDDRVDRWLSHEYYHLLQHAAAAGGDARPPGPAWISEGTAEYAAGSYIEHKYAVDARDGWVGNSHLYEGTFADLASAFPRSGRAYGIAALAVDWLVERSGSPRSHVEYWERIGSGASWPEAFARTFGITPGDFIAAFDEYRSDLRQGAPRIRGVVVDLEGRALPGEEVYAHPDSPYGVPLWAITSAGGAFELSLPAGSYALFLKRAGPQDLAYDGTSGYANACGPATMYTLDAGAAVDVVIRVLPELLVRPDPPPCNEGVPGYHVIRSVVTGPRGEPVPAFDRERYRGVQVAVIPFPYQITRHRFDGLVQSGGIARSVVPDGRYLLEIRELAGAGASDARRLGWYGGGGFTAERDRATVIEVAGAGVGDIEIPLPAAPGELPTARFP